MGKLAILNSPTGVGPSRVTICSIGGSLTIWVSTLFIRRSWGGYMVEKRASGGSVRLLAEGDMGAMNKFGKPIVGWNPSSQGFGGLVNLMGFAFSRVVVQKIIDEKLEDLYDQPLIVENPGSVVIPQLGDKFGLVQNYRFNGERIKTANPGYIKSLNEENRWEELMANLGQWRWELPAGLSPDDSSSVTLEEIALKAAKLEAQEEGGFTIADAKIVGKINFNPTFFAHAQYIVLGQIEAQGEQKAEDLEILGGTHLFNPFEIRELINSGDFDDGRSLSAFAMAGIQIPL